MEASCTWNCQPFGEMNVKYRHVMCRLCLSKSGIMTDIHGCMLGSEFIVATVITDLLQIQVSATDCYPRLICLECLGKLQDLQRFKDSCWQAKVNFDAQYLNPPFPDVYGAVVECGGDVTNTVNQGGTMEDPDEYSKPCTEEEGEGNNLHSEIYIKEEAIEESDVKDPLSLESSYIKVEENSKEGITIKDEETQMNERPTVEGAPVSFMMRSSQITLSQDISKNFKNIIFRKDPSELNNTLRSSDAHNGENGMVKIGKEGNDLMRNGINVGGNAVNGTAIGKGPNNLIRNSISAGETKEKIPSVQYFCQKCCKIFTSMCDLVKHNCAKDSVINFECKVCCKKFETENILWSHMQTHNLSMRYYCKICRMGFLREEYLSIHFSLHDNKFPITPDVSSNLRSGENVSDIDQSQRNCDQDKVVHNDSVTAGSEKKQAESRLQKAKTKYVCPFCSGGFSSSYTLEKHIYLKHPEKYNDYNRVRKKSFTEKGSEKSQRENVCPICCGKFSSVVTLKRHMRHQHTEKKFECKICHKKFRNEERVECHARLHRENRPFHCEVCGAGFFKEKLLSKHILYHARDDPFQCDHCGKTHPHKRGLWRHIALCYRLKLYECDVCNKKFSCKSYLSIHKTIHTGEKKHMCEVCGRTFRYPNTLLVHKRQHTGEKPYFCDICDKRFVQKISFNQHKKKYHK